jgi:hypothetical protein
MRIRVLTVLCLGSLANPVLAAPAGDAPGAAAAPTPVVANVRWASHFERPADLVQAVDAIVVAEWRGAREGRIAYLAEGTGIPFTLNAFSAQQVLKGDIAPGAEITLEQTGGRFDEFVVSIDDGGPYTQGRYLLFLDRQEDTGYYLLVNPQGRYKILRDRLLAAKADDAVAERFNGLDLKSALERIRALRER